MGIFRLCGTEQRNSFVVWDSFKMRGWKRVLMKYYYLARVA
jgi:hypothetical protein